MKAKACNKFGFEISKLKSAIPGLALLMLMVALSSAFAAVRYVDVNSANPAPPYASWATAAATIQDAVAVAGAGDEIIVTNGLYNSGAVAYYGRVAVMVPLSLHSVNGAKTTLIDGAGQMRCVYLTNGVSLSGFTLTNGAADSGGGAYCESTNVFISNCVIVSNTASDGGGVSQGTLNDCALIANSAPAWIDYGGGAYRSILKRCLLMGNHAYSDGGGAIYSVLNNCLLLGNTASQGTFGRPITSYGNGGGAADSTLNNCTLLGNRAAYAGGAVIRCYLTNCTLAGNNTWAAWSSTLYNCISFSNSDGNFEGCTMNYCCTSPDPGGIGNIILDPQFVNLAGGNLRLQSNSPCINAGNNSYVSSSTDLDGRPRIVGSTVDMGAYEFQPGVSGMFIGWLQQYGLATDGSADYIDSDGDGRNNWQEWRCQTVPTNALSVLKIVSALRTGNDVVITWQSMAGVDYFIERSTNLAAAPPFSPLATNVPGQAGTTSYLDSGAAGASPLFYRVGVGN